MTGGGAHLLEGLNPPQIDAVSSTEGPLLVIAGAGSGKTRVITHRIAYLIEELGIGPSAIFATTFTNKAAREMKRRVVRLCRAVDAARLPVATFHAHCAAILRREAGAVGLTPKFAICDATDQIALLRDSIREMGHDPKRLTPGTVQDVISLAKMRLLEGQDAWEYIARLRDGNQADVYRRYQERLTASDAVDFDDLLLLVVRLWRDNPDLLRAYQESYRYVLVDEYQDTNLAQFELVRLLTESHRNLCVVGDEDQSIYSWRGAEITNLLEFQKHFPEARIIRLEQNYRSTGNILSAAAALIARNTQRLGKTLWTEGGAGDPILEIDAESAEIEAREIVTQVEQMHYEGLPYEEMAIFYRVNALSRVYEEALRDARVPYRVIGGVGFYDRAEIKDLLSYLQLVANPGHTPALLRIINKPARGIGKTAFANLVRYCTDRRITLFEAIMDAGRLSEAGLKGRAASGALDLARLVTEWTLLAKSATLRQLAEAIVRGTNYMESLGDPQSLEALSRTENIQEFLGALDEYTKENVDASLDIYLERVALRSADEKDVPNAGVSLMTVHNAKGLEFDVVFIVALEKEVFPNARALRDQGHAQEERRLFYVALTRARKRVYVSHVQRRLMYGAQQWPTPSIFFYEIPKYLRVPLRRASLGPVPHAAAPVGPFDQPFAASTGTKGTQRTKETTATTATGTAGTAGTQPESSPSSFDLHPSSFDLRPSSLASAPRLFRHELLGVVALVSETGFGSQRRFVVRDASGMNHTLLASYARLRPVDPASDEVRRFLALSQASSKAVGDETPASGGPGASETKPADEATSLGGTGAPETGPAPPKSGQATPDAGRVASTGSAEDTFAPLENDDDELPF